MPRQGGREQHRDDKGERLMPQRFLRPGITTSESWNKCSWQAQSFYIRLLTLVDDFGRYDGRWKMLRSHAFPLNDDITCEQLSSLCEQLHTNALAIFYQSSDGKEYVQLNKWREKDRSEPKFPAFDDSCKQWFSIDNKCSSPSPSPSSSPTPPAKAGGGRSLRKNPVRATNGPVYAP